MKEEEVYRHSMLIVRQLCDIMKKQELQDITALKEWLEKNELAADVIQELMDDKVLLQHIEMYRRSDKEKEVKRLSVRIHRYRLHRRIVRLTAVAALAFLVIGVGIWNKKTFREQAAFTEAELPVVQTTPLLILADGKQMVLDGKEENFAVALPENGIVYQDREELKYDQSEGHTSDALPSQLNRLMIPRQCNYRVVLSDGSVVHLNAESQLEYPTQFGADERRVILKGEAYFEVKPGQQPFIVEANQVDIRVYGTKFNVNAYADDYLETVLVEGKVGLSLQADAGQTQMLKPSQWCAVNLRKPEFQVAQVDVNPYISWTKGYLRYDNDSLEKLLQDLERWYNVDFVFSVPKLKELKISASINKDVPLEEVLAMIETTLKVKFNQAERKYTIYQ